MSAIESVAIESLDEAERAALAAAAVPHPRPHVVRIAIGPEATSRVVDHVANIEYLRWIDRVAELASDAAGWPRAELASADLMWFVARHELDYVAECRAGERLLAATWVRDVQRVRSWRDTAILRPADGAVVMRASTLWVLVQLSTRRARRVPPEMIRAFQPLVVAGATGEACASP